MPAGESRGGAWRPCRAVLFDAAGTLLGLREPVGRTYLRQALAFGSPEPSSPDPARRLEDSFRRALCRQGPLAFRETDPASLVHLEREWWKTVVRETVRRVLRVAHFDGFFDSLYDHYSTSRAWALEPGCREVLAALRERQVPVAVVSNFDSRLPGLLGSLGVAHLLSEVVFSSRVGLAKPDPEIFRLVLDRLSVRAQDCCHVGDDPEDDARGASRAGIRPLLYDPADRHTGLSIERIRHLGEVLERCPGSR